MPKNLYIVDLKNALCKQYELVDSCNLTFRLVAKLPLQVAGPCDRLTGWAVEDFKKVQNIVRDNNPECKK